MIAVLVVCGWRTFAQGALLDLRYNGFRVEHPDHVLMDAVARLKEEAQRNQGSVVASSRCYFVTAPGDNGKVPVPITANVACGPVMFSGGSVRVPYLEFALDVAPPAHDHVAMTVDRTQQPVPISAPPPGQRLIRPDRIAPPDGTGDLDRPQVPPAIGDVLAKAAVVTPSPATTSIALVGRSSGVKLLSFGPVTQYGTGATARSAPAGRALIAFKVAAITGEDGTQSAPQLFLRIDDAKRKGPLALTNDYIVTAVPTNARRVDLVLADPGGDQAVSLLTGKADPSNPAVVRRAHRGATLSFERPVNLKVSGAKGSGITSGRVSITSVSLLYWAPDGTHASGPNRALLEIVATMRLAGDRADFGVEPDLLQASGTGDVPAKARNSAAKGSHQIVAVVDVPADITTGSILFTGMTTIAGKGTLTVQTPLTVNFTIPAG